MTILEAQNFYKSDKKEYELKNNVELLHWLKEKIKNGYHPPMNVKDLQDLIDIITYWYEMKYPERELELENGIENLDFLDINSLIDVMTIPQLMYRTDHHQLCFMKGKYRSHVGGITEKYDDEGNIVGYKKLVGISIEKKETALERGSYNLLTVDSETGEVWYDDEKCTTGQIEDLLKLFQEKYKNELDFSDLEECVYNHNCDIELRNWIFQLVSLKLVYSRNTVPERGYKRAKSFIREFNEYFGLILSSDAIDEIMSRDYSGKPIEKGISWLRRIKKRKNNEIR